MSWWTGGAIANAQAQAQPKQPILKSNEHEVKSDSKRVNSDAHHVKSDPSDGYDGTKVDIHARASEWVYRKPGERAGLLEQYGLGDYTMDDRYNHDRFAVLHHKTNNSSIAIHRGTDTSSLDDLGADVDIVGQSFTNNPHYMEAYFDMQAALTNNKGRDWTTAGHSLGGTTAHHMGNEFRVESYAFNPGHSLVGKYNMKRPGQSRDFTDTQNHHGIYATRGDIISAGVANESSPVYWNKKREGTKNEHSVVNWISGDFDPKEV